jgi:hypothetical protein
MKTMASLRPRERTNSVGSESSISESAFLIICFFLLPAIVRSAPTQQQLIDFAKNPWELTDLSDDVRTGCYSVQTGTKDGFIPEPTRASTATATLAQFHSSDVNRDGKISLLELTRVIELYNFRSGTTRTGQYDVHAGTEDGFVPGP